MVRSHIKISAKRKVLYVDDESHLTSAFKRQFKSKIFVYTANSAEEGLSILKHNNDISIIITDYHMPGVNGVDFLKQATNIAPKTVKIMFTGNTDLNVAVEALHECEIYRFLTKPCPSKLLEKSIDDAIEKYDVIKLKEQLASTASELEKVNHSLNENIIELQKVNEQLEVEKADNDFELQIAKEVFDRLTYTHNNDVRYLKTWISSMSEFSGDLLISTSNPSGRIYVMLADFTGHGLPAAIGAPLAANIFMRKATSGYALPEIVEELNLSLFHALPTHLFCAAGLIEIDPCSNKLSIWNGGLPDIFLIHRDKASISRIESTSPPLGIMIYNEIDLHPEQYELESNSSAFLYSDGLIEAKNEFGKMYGIERLNDNLTSNMELDNLFDEIKIDVNKFVGTAKQNDDITIVNILFDKIDRIISPSKNEEDYKYNCLQAINH